MTQDEFDGLIKSMREDLLGPEETLEHLIKKRNTAENLLSHLELDYQKKREEHSQLPPIWFDTKSTLISASTAIVVLVIGILFVFFGHMELDLLKIVVPLSVGIGMIPLIVFSAKNNYNYQRKNALLSSRLSEMMSIRSKITLLQEKQLELTPTPQKTDLSPMETPQKKDLSPMEIRKDIIAWLERTLSYINSIIQIPEYKAEKIPEADAKAKQILIKANQEFSVPEWRTLMLSMPSTGLPNSIFDSDLSSVYDHFVKVLSNPDFINRGDIKLLKGKIDTILSTYLRNKI